VQCVAAGRVKGKCEMCLLDGLKYKRDICLEIIKNCNMFLLIRSISKSEKCLQGSVHDKVHCCY